LKTLEGPIYEHYQAAAQVSVIDVDNDLKLDLFGETYFGNDTKPTRVFWINKGEQVPDMFGLEIDPYGDSPLLVPHSSAFVGTVSPLLLFSSLLTPTSFSYLPL
jgi:hypothetical protein